MNSGKLVSDRQLFSLVFVPLLSVMLFGGADLPSAASYIAAWAAYSAAGCVLFLAARKALREKQNVGAGGRVLFCGLLLYYAGETIAQTARFLLFYSSGGFAPAACVGLFVVVCGYALFTGVEPVGRFSFVALGVCLFFSLLLLLAAAGNFSPAALGRADFSAAPEVFLRLLGELSVFAAAGVYAAEYTNNGSTRALLSAAGSAAVWCFAVFPVANGTLGAAFSRVSYPLYTFSSLSNLGGTVAYSVFLFWIVSCAVKVSMLMFAAYAVLRRGNKCANGRRQKFLLCAVTGAFAVAAFVLQVNVSAAAEIAIFAVCAAGCARAFAAKRRDGEL